MPGLRRLLDPGPDPEDDARLWRAEGEHRFRVGHRLLGPVALLHEHVRLPLHPRPSSDPGNRPEAGQSWPDGVGHHRRRRCAVDRWQPHPSLDAAQRRHQGRDVQQPHLRPDQGPGIANVRAGQEDQVVAAGHDRLPDSAAVDRTRRRGELRGSLGRHAHRAPAGDARARRIPPRLRRSSRCSRTATSSTTARTATSPSATSARIGCSSSSTASR